MKDCNEVNRAATAAAAPVEVPARGSGHHLKGKIGRLPHSVRETLNERLRDGLPSSEILAWLNDLPETQEVLQKRFDALPITEPNLSRWRAGGFAGWREDQQVNEAASIMKGAGRNMDQSERDALAEQLALVVKARMVFELQRFDALPEGPAKSGAFKELVWSLALLQRGEFYAGKLRLERDKLPLRKETEKAPMCDQEQQEYLRNCFGQGGPHWNNVTKQWEGEGADEMREKEEVERMVLAELRRRKQERLKAKG